jgi:hypothetical protein
MIFLRNTWKFSEDYHLSLTQRLGKMAIPGQPPWIIQGFRQGLKRDADTP